MSNDPVRFHELIQKVHPPLGEPHRPRLLPVIRSRSTSGTGRISRADRATDPRTSRHATSRGEPIRPSRTRYPPAPPRPPPRARRPGSRSRGSAAPSSTTRRSTDPVVTDSDTPTATAGRRTVRNTPPSPRTGARGTDRPNRAQGGRTRPEVPSRPEPRRPGTPPPSLRAG